jgi:hypothetical protein
MKIAASILNLAKSLNQSASLAVSLPQTETVLLSLQRQDQPNAELYRLLRQQNQLLLQRLRSLQANPPAASPLEVQGLNQLAQVHCRLVGWLAGGDSSGGPKFDAPQSGQTPTPAPAKEPTPSPDSSAQHGPALDFN